MLKIAICDDQNISLNTIVNCVQTAFESFSTKIEISTFQNPGDFLSRLNQQSFDAVFLDIDMPKYTGFDIAATLHNDNKNTLIIFVTSKYELVYDSFEYQPFYFIRKTSLDSLQTDITHVVKKVCSHYKQNKQIQIHDIVLGELSIRVRDIQYIQSEKHYLLYYLNSRSGTPMKERGTLDTKAKELTDYDFCRPHQRYLVNMRYIDNFSAILDGILLTTGETVPISKRQKESTLNQYRIYRRK